MNSDYVIVFVTTPNLGEAQKIAGKLVSKKLAAGVNILPGITSIYTWMGEICEANEVLLMIKTRSDLFEMLTEIVQTEHSYEVPEVIATSITTGSASYLNWIKEVTHQA